MTEVILNRAREGREAIKTLKTPAIEGLAVVLFPLCMVAVVLSGCSEAEKRERREARRLQAQQQKFDRLYESCIYRVTGPFGTASVEVMRECAKLASEGRTAPGRPK